MENKGLLRLQKIREINQRTPGWKNRDLFRLMTKPDLYMSCYEKIRRNKGALTQGTDQETAEAFSLQKIEEIIKAISEGTFNFNPARRIYIPKPGKKEKRPLGIPNFKDKLVQDVIRMILEVIYEPTFSPNSHGFRPNRSCHTALKQIEQSFNGIKWVVEGDIKGAYDNVNHQILLGILAERIEDPRFINLIAKALKAGYLEDSGCLIKPLIGTPQGSLVSPILANIYLDKLDKYMEVLKNEYERANENKPWKGRGEFTDQYNRIRNDIRNKEGQIKKLSASELLKKQLLVKEVQLLKTEQKHIITRKPETVPIRIQYVRYADDWLVGINGPQYIAKEIKEKISLFLKESLGLTLSDNKTHITYIRKDYVLFLGYHLKIDISRKVTSYVTKKGSRVTRRSTGHIIKFYLPTERYLKRLHMKGICDNTGRARSVPQWTILEPEKIVETYNFLLNGLFSYYSHIQNTDHIRRIQFIIQMSCAKTLAHKYKSSVYKIFTRYGKTLKIYYKKTADGIDKRTYRELSIRKEIPQNAKWGILRKEPLDPFFIQVNLRSRSKLDKHCAVCLNEHDVEMHHIKHVRKASIAKGFDKLLGIINRKQIPVCRDCHKRIHAGLYDGIELKDLADPYLAKF